MNTMLHYANNIIMGLLNNLSKLLNNNKIEVHHVFDDLYGYHMKHVADIYVSDKLNTKDALAKAYMLSQSISDAWYQNKYVDCKVSHARSTQMGDIFKLNNVSYVVTDKGFEQSDLSTSGGYQ